MNDNQILEALKNIDNKLEYIKNKIDKDSSVLNKHISFIESIYETIKSPIHFICNKFNNKKQLPLTNTESSSSSE